MKSKKSAFMHDVSRGLSSTPKYLSSKYFYDNKGSRIFQSIMKMKSYYLTDCEMDILSHQAHSIYESLSFGVPFSVVEFGAGDGEKTERLLAFFSNLQLDYTYMPVDISSEALHMLCMRLSKKLPTLKTQPIVGDYHTLLEENKLISPNRPCLCLFLGSNIGNYAREESATLLMNIFASLKKGDKLLLGADLKKDPRIIQSAYDDSEGITQDFNLNLLRRINTELGADFKLDLFDFYSSYSLECGEVRSYLFSKEKQHVRIDALDSSFYFDAYEWIHTETSRKYSLHDIECMTKECGFKHLAHFLDSKSYYSDSLFVKE